MCTPRAWFNSFFGYSTSLLHMWGSRYLTTVETTANIKQGRTFTHLVLLTRWINCWGYAGVTNIPGMIKSLEPGRPSNKTMYSGPEYFRHTYWLFFRHAKNVCQFTCTQQKASDIGEAGGSFQNFASTVWNCFISQFGTYSIRGLSLAFETPLDPCVRLAFVCELGGMQQKAAVIVCSVVVPGESYERVSHGGKVCDRNSRRTMRIGNRSTNTTFRRQMFRQGFGRKSS